MVPDIGSHIDAQDSFDLKLVSDILMQLNVVRKNTVLYPRGHPQLEASLSRITRFMEKHFAYHPALTLAVTRDSLILGEWELPRTNPIFQELAAHLHEHSIYQISFSPGVNSEEIHLLCRVLSGDPLCIERGEKIVDALNRMGVRYISLSILDVSQFEFSEETEVDLDEQLLCEGSSGASWQNYIRALLEKGAEEGLTEEDDGIELTNVDPVLLAQFLNQMEKRASKKVSYDRAAADYIRNLGVSDAVLDQVKDTHVKESFLGLVANLNAELRGELLSKDFEFSSRGRNVTPAIFDTPPAKILLEALEDINRWGMRIDTRMLSLLDRLASADVHADLQEDLAGEMNEDEEHLFSQISLAFLTTTGFRPRAYPDDRKKLAVRLFNEVTGLIKDKRVESRTEKGLEAEFSTDAISGHLTKTLLDLLEESEDADFAEVCCESLSVILARTLLDGRFDQLIYIWNELALMEQGAKTAEKAEMCRKARAELKTPENLSAIALAIRDKRTGKSEELADILRELSSQSAECMINSLCDEADEAARRVLVEFVAENYWQTRDAILAVMVEEKRPEALLALMGVVRKARDKGALTLVENLLEHPDARVRVDALSSLTVLGHPKAAEHIVAAMADPDPDFALGAVNVAGMIQDPKVISALLAVVKDSRLLALGYGVAKKKAAIKALSFIGSQEALPELLKLVSSKKFFNSKEFEKIKLDIFKSLEGYDPEKTRPFVEIGLKSGDLAIANICENLMQKISVQKA